MILRIRRCCGVVAVMSILVLPAAAFANRTGPPAGVNGSVASFGSTCRVCHGSTVGAGSVQILGAPTLYQSNMIYDIIVRVSDPATTQTGAGFQISVENGAGSHVGTLSVSDPVRTQSNLGWINHNSTGVSNSVSNWLALGRAAEYNVRWQAPAGDIGPVTFWAAGNAINNNLASSGDRIYLTNMTATFQAATGACCDDSDGSCMEGLTQASCTGMGLRYGNDGSTCATIDPPCVQPTGACCNESTGSCSEDVSQTLCESMGNRYGNDGSTCATIDPPCVPLTGACCDDVAGNCTDDLTQAQCDNLGLGFRYGGDDSTCATIDPPCAPATPPLAIGLEIVASGLSSPVGVANSGDGTGRLFVVDQPGRIRVIDAGGNLLPIPFLDVSALLPPLGIDFGGGFPLFDERGLLGLAFHPNFENNGKFYIRYSRLRTSTGSEPCDLDFPPGECHEEVLAEYTVSGNPRINNVANPGSGVVLLTVSKPQWNHNAGDLAFGPDGFLYVSFGDGGGANDGLHENPPSHGPIGSGQNLETLLGKMLRIDVDGGSPYAIPPDNPFVGIAGRDEIYAYGLRNPYQFSFDDGPGGDNKLYLGDVGQDLFEEVDIITRGGNYGWAAREGAHFFGPLQPFSPPASCLQLWADAGIDCNTMIDPVDEYLHSVGGLSVIGGFVYRGSVYPPLQGKYVYGDFSGDFGPTGRLYYFDTTGPETHQRKEFYISPRGDPFGLFLKGFGEDEDGEVYVCASNELGPGTAAGRGTGDTGVVFRIVPPRLPSIGLEVVASGLSSPVMLVNSGDNTGRLFVVDQPGRIRVIDAGGNLLPTPFLDVSALLPPLGIDFGGGFPLFDERGLLGMTFHPNFENNGKFYIRYSRLRTSTGSEPCDLDIPPGVCHEEVLAEYTVQGNPLTNNVADASSGLVLLTIPKPQWNHNSGGVTFGPDGYLYMTMGDGGGANDGLHENPPSHGPIGSGQNLETHLGKILRIDPIPGVGYAIPPTNPFVGVAGLDEIYAYGLRNPFSFSFDDGPGGDGKLYLADVGQDLFEEVDIITSGGNYGWAAREGAHFFDPLRTLNPPASCLQRWADAGIDCNTLIDPVDEYLHSVGGVSVIAGFVYRGSAYPALQGKFIYGDFSADFGPTGRLYYFDTTGPEAYVRKHFYLAPDDAPFGHFLKGFGEDENGEIYVCASDELGPGAATASRGQVDGTTGLVFRLVPPAPTVVGEAPRSIGVTLPPTRSPVRILVTPICQTAGGTAQYVGRPSVRTGVARLVDNPADAALLSSAQWGDTVHVTGLVVAPSREYNVQIDYGGVGSPALSPVFAATTKSHGDVDEPFNPPDPTDQPDFVDITALVDAFRGLLGALPTYRVDLFGDQVSACTPDGLIDFSDITEVVNAFRGQEYGCPDPCAVAE